MRAADYYFQHLDRKVQVVVVSDANLSGNPLNPTAPQQQSTDTAVPLAATNTADDELDQLLQGGGPEDFDLGGLQPLQSCNPQVWSLVCCGLCCTYLYNYANHIFHRLSVLLAVKAGVESQNTQEHCLLVHVTICRQPVQNV